MLPVIVVSFATDNVLPSVVAPVTTKVFPKFAAPIALNLPPTLAVLATYKPVFGPCAIKIPLILAWPELVNPNTVFVKYT